MSFLFWCIALEFGPMRHAYDRFGSIHDQHRAIAPAALGFVQRRIGTRNRVLNGERRSLLVFLTWRHVCGSAGGHRNAQGRSVERDRFIADRCQHTAQSRRREHRIAVVEREQELLAAPTHRFRARHAAVVLPPSATRCRRWHARRCH